MHNAPAFVRSLCLVATLAGAFAALPARAEQAGDCTAVGDLADNPTLALGRIAAGGPRTNFVHNSSDKAGCPNETAACKARGFLVPGDTVIMGRRNGAFVCADYVGRKGAVRSGWLPAAAVTALEEPSVAPTDWHGTWEREEAKITIKPGAGKDAGKLAIHGEATYGALDPDRVKRGAVNLGEIDAAFAPTGPALAFTMGTDATLPVTAGETSDCKVWMRRLGSFLIVDDNMNCGGMNVRFTGVYSRTK